MTAGSGADSAPEFGARTRAGARPGARNVAAVSAGVAITVAAIRLVVGAQTRSLAVLGSGLDALSDAAATLITLYAVRLADKPPDREHAYGHGRAENIAALLQSFVFVAAGALLARNAIGRLSVAEPVAWTAGAIGIVAAAAVVDVVRSVVLRRASRRFRSPALKADALNFTQDVVASAVTLLAVLATTLGVVHADAVGALVVVGLLWILAARLGVSAVHVLMDRTPPGLDEAIRNTALMTEGVESVDAVRVRSSGPNALADVWVRIGRTESVERSHEITRRVENRVAQAVAGASAIVHVAPSVEGEDIVRTVFAAANRLGLADQVHNVLAVETVDGVWLTLHAKVDPEISLEAADVVTDLLEAELRAEIGTKLGTGLARIEIHLEPRETQALRGAVVERGDLAAAATSIAESCPPIQRCHEVAVLAVDDRLHIVLHCDAGAHVQIGAVHRASRVVEDELHRRYPEVDSITIHFEPTEPSS